MIAANQDQTNLTVICRRLAIKVTKTLDINVPGISDNRFVIVVCLELAKIVRT